VLALHAHACSGGSAYKQAAFGFVARRVAAHPSAPASPDLAPSFLITGRGSVKDGNDVVMVQEVRGGVGQGGSGLEVPLTVLVWCGGVRWTWWVGAWWC
jgi:hypothetical protein